MKEYYYYIRDEEKKPRITVCLLQVDDPSKKINCIAKGIAICCMKDNPCKKEGRNLAKERALLALKNKAHCLPMVWRKNITLNEFYHFKAYFEPQLTEYEGRILYGGFGV